VVESAGDKEDKTLSFIMILAELCDPSSIDRALVEKSALNEGLIGEALTGLIEEVNTELNDRSMIKIINIQS